MLTFLPYACQSDTRKVTAAAAVKENQEIPKLAERQSPTAQTAGFQNCLRTSYKYLVFKYLQNLSIFLFNSKIK